MHARADTHHRECGERNRGLADEQHGHALRDFFQSAGVLKAEHAVAVVVLDMQEGRAVQHPDGQFLGQFARQRGNRLLAGFELAAGKFPQAAQVFAQRPAGEQDAVGVGGEDDAGDHPQPRRGVRFRSGIRH